MTLILALCIRSDWILLTLSVQDTVTLLIFFALWNTTSCLFLVDRNIYIHILAWKCLRLHANPRRDPNMLHFMLEGKPKSDSVTKGEHSAKSNTKPNSHCQHGAGE